MERKRLINKALTGAWVLLILGVVFLFLGNRLGGLREIISRLRREPQNLVSTFKPREMEGFVCDFSRPEDLKIWTSHNSALSVGVLPGENTRPWLRVTYYPSQAPGLLWTDETMGTMDWRRAQTLDFLAYNPNGWTVDLKVKIKDAAGAKWQHSYKLDPGRETPVSIPLSSIAGQIAPGRITYLNLFLWEPNDETILYFTDFRLPPPGDPMQSRATGRDREASLEFLGFEFPAVVAPGMKTEASFYFMPTRSLQGKHLLLVSLDSGSLRIPLLREIPPLPPVRWRPGKLAKIGPIEIEIPPSTSPGTYDLVVALAREEGSEQTREMHLEPYANPEIEGHSVAKIRVWE